MHYTSRVGDLPKQAHINYECPCGCTAGLMYERDAGSMHLGECCCGRLLWVGDGARNKVQAAFRNDRTYLLDRGEVTLPWGETVPAVLAIPAAEAIDPGERASMAVRVRDVVCGMYIDPAEAAATSNHEGITYYFCALVCKTKFDSEPARYLKL